MSEKMRLLIFMVIFLSSTTVSLCNTAVMGPNTLIFSAPSDLYREESDTPFAMEDETLYAYALGNQDTSRVCAFYLHDRIVPTEFELINDTLWYWLSYGTVRVHTYNSSTGDTIQFGGDGITKEGAHQAYGFAKALNITDDRNAAMEFFVLKTVGLSKEEANDVFSSINVIR